MRFSTDFRYVVVMLATVGIIVPQIAYAGNDHQDTVRPAKPAVRDVALSRNGQLSGQLLDGNGVAVPGGRILLQQEGKPVATAITSPNGHFVIDRLTAGIYQIQSEKSAGVYRVWTAEGAPPAAHSRVLLVDDGQVVRGLHGGNVKQTFVIGGLIITAGVIGGVIGYNIRDVGDAS